MLILWTIDKHIHTNTQLIKYKIIAMPIHAIWELKYCLYKSAACKSWQDLAEKVEKNQESEGTKYKWQAQGWF